MERNPYFQYFCGFSDFQTALPCHSTDLVYFRNRIGKRIEFILKHSIGKFIVMKNLNESQVIADTTIQESNLTYPTDGKLAIKIINHLHKIVKVENIKLKEAISKR